jgi:uncharacterized protein with PQ loop repeat
LFLDFKQAVTLTKLNSTVAVNAAQVITCAITFTCFSFDGTGSATTGVTHAYQLADLELSPELPMQCYGNHVERK